MQTDSGTVTHTQRYTHTQGQENSVTLYAHVYVHIPMSSSEIVTRSFQSDAFCLAFTRTLEVA